MTYILQLIAIGISVLFLFELIMQMKKKKISEEHSVLWMMGVIGILCLSIFPNILTRVAHFLGVWWPPATLIFFLLTVLVIIGYRHTVSITKMEAEIKELAMQVALLKEQIHELQLEKQKDRKR